MKKIVLDMHTHTIASGHAYSTLTEMVRAAADKELKLFGITEHATGIPGTCADIYFSNMKVIPRKMFGVDLMLGAEVNILDYEGTLSLDKKHLDYLDIRIAGMHKFCYRAGTAEENTRAVIKAMESLEIDIISHPDDSNFPLEYREVVEASKKYHTLLEVNNNAIRATGRKNVRENYHTMLTLCRELLVPVIMGSDAHYMDDVGNVAYCQKVLEEENFPEELVMNYHVDAFQEFIQYNREVRKP